MKNLILLLILSFPVFSNVKIATYPYKIVGNTSYLDFIAKISKVVEEASKKNADLVVFPELLSLDILAETEDKVLNKNLMKIAKLADQYSKDISNLAKKNKIEIVAGTFHYLKNDKIFNAAFYANKNGEVTLQDKIHLTPWEEKMGWQAGNEIEIIQSTWGKLAILICYDIEFPRLSSLLGRYDLDVIIIPSQTDDIAGLKRVQYTSRARAIEQLVYIVNVGATSEPQAQWHTYQGNANFYVPQLNAFAGMEKELNMNEERLHFFDLNLELLRVQKKIKSNIYPLRDEIKRVNPITVNQ